MWFGFYILIAIIIANNKANLTIVSGVGENALMASINLVI
jgi:hypothetical protein